MRGIAFVTILALFTISQAEAHPRHHRHHYRHHHVNPVVQGLGIGLAHMLATAKDPYSGPAYHYTPDRPGTGYPNLLDVPPQGWPLTPKKPLARLVGRVLDRIEEILPHPSGCPRTAFCGCGAASYLLGSPIRNLWLASNWFSFPRAAPGPGMAAVRRHHVMAIISYHGDGTATVYDANSGRHQTRIHQVSLRGYVIVDPHRRYAGG